MWITSKQWIREMFEMHNSKREMQVWKPMQIWMTNVKYEMWNLKCELHIWKPMQIWRPNVKYETRNVKYETRNLKYEMHIWKPMQIWKPTVQIWKTVFCHVANLFSHLVFIFFIFRFCCTFGFHISFYDANCRWSQLAFAEIMYHRASWYTTAYSICASKSPSWRVIWSCPTARPTGTQLTCEHAGVKPIDPTTSRHS